MDVHKNQPSEADTISELLVSTSPLKKYCHLTRGSGTPGLQALHLGHVLVLQRHKG